MTPLPPQHPDRRRTSLRRANDRYTFPDFGPPRSRPVRPEPYERYDPANEPRPFSWSEMRDPDVIVGGLLMFVSLVVVVVLLGLVAVE